MLSLPTEGDFNGDISDPLDVLCSGFCQRISRQTSQLVGSGHHTRRGRGWAYYPVPVRRHPANVQYGDEIFEKDQMMGTKGGKSVLHIIGIDKRPKCQPIGAQIDCR